MKSTHQARPTSTPKKVSHRGFLKVDPTIAKRCTPTSKTTPKLYNKQAMG